MARLLRQDEIIKLLQQVSLFAELPEKALLELATYCRYREFGAKETLFHEGDDGHMLYILVSGEVSIQRVSEKGEIVHIATRGAGEQFGELSLLDGKPRTADVVTEERCSVLTLSREPFLNWLGRSPEIAKHLLASLASRLREATDRTVQYRSHSVMGRLCTEILEWVEKHGERESQGGTRITLKMTQQQMAERVGADRATVNRMLSTLKSMGAIDRREGYLVVLKPERVKRYSEE